MVLEVIMRDGRGDVGCEEGGFCCGCVVVIVWYFLWFCGCDGCW